MSSGKNTPIDPTVATSSAKLPLADKFREITSLGFMRLKGLFYRRAQRTVVFVADEYNEMFQKYNGTSIAGLKAFEIGFGSKPILLFTLMALGVDVYGADLDVPLINGTPGEVIEVLRKNGLERALKSIARFFLTDFRERRELDQDLRRRGARLKFDRSRLIIQDATTVDIPDHSLDLVYSENVFEHIPAESLERIVPCIARWLKPNGLALIRPDVFTGISGNHLAEWFSNTVSDKSYNRRSEPWEHLRKRRFRPNTYLNELPRSYYRELFSRHFEILEEQVACPGLGAEFLTPELRAELHMWPDEELFSNKVRFVLRPRPEAK